MSTGTMCKTKTVAPLCLAIFAASSRPFSELESKSTGARIRLNGKAISSAWSIPIALGTPGGTVRTTTRQHDRSGQRENPCHHWRFLASFSLTHHVLLQERCLAITSGDSCPATFRVLL